MTKQKLILSVLLLFLLLGCVCGIGLHKEKHRYDAFCARLKAIPFTENDQWTLKRIRYHGVFLDLGHTENDFVSSVFSNLTPEDFLAARNIYPSNGGEYALLLLADLQGTNFDGEKSMIFGYCPGIPTRIFFYPSTPEDVEDYDLAGNRHDMIHTPELIQLMLDLIPYEREGSSLTATRHLPGETAHKVFTEGITDFLRILTTAEDRTSLLTGKMPDTHGKTPDTDLYYSFEIITEGEADRYEATYYLYEGKNGWHLDSAAGGAYILTDAAAGKILNLFQLSDQ